MRGHDPLAPELEARFVRDLEREDPHTRWLIEEIWGRSAVGILGGSAKVGKSWLGLDLALSVASGTPALGRFPVVEPGTALVYVAVDALPQVRARIVSLCAHRGVDLEGLDLAVITAPVLRLDTERDQARLRALLARLRPRVLLLDPLVRLHALDENSSHEIAGLLGYFRELQRTFDTAVILAHHTSKKPRAHPGQSLRGSSDLHAFGDSNAYLFRKAEATVLVLEHRSAKAIAPLTLDLATEGDVTYLRVRDQGEEVSDAPATPALETRVVEVLRSHPTPLSRTDLRERLRVNNQRLGDALHRLEASKKVRHLPDGWSTLPVPSR
jgi:hypothetical protein